MKNIMFIAPPAAGKGTQAELIEERYKKFNFCIKLMVANVILSITLAFIGTFISLNGGIKL